VNKPGKVPEDESRGSRPVFVSYATADRKEALSVCKAIESRGTRCWISTRDVAPGENYQEAIVRALRSARAMVLVFSEAANNSDEIKKELSLASRYHVPVMALRIEDVEPSDAFAYELSTRQWIDAFAGWDKSIDSLVRQLGQISGTREPGSAAPTVEPPRRAASQHRRGLFAAPAIGALLLAIVGAWWLLHPQPVTAHSMMVRLTGYQRLSADLPAAMPDAVRDEIIAAFGDQGVVGVSTASAPAPGPAPAYALGGTIRRDGNQIRVITRLTNERSGATLWSSSANYDASQISRVPRRIAVGTGKMARCGLFAASTYSKPLPDSVLVDYMQYCQNAPVFGAAPQKALDSARKVVSAAPSFSWGWSAVTLASARSQYVIGPGTKRDEVRRIGLQAADRALSLDRRNSEALAMKAMLIDPTDYLGQERLLKQAIAARPLDCGCEHFLYGLVLENVGRYVDAADEFRRAVDMLALDENSQFTLGDSLTVIGKHDEARPHFDAAVDLATDPGWPAFIAISEAPETGDYQAAIRLLQDPKVQLPQAQRSAFLAGFQAMASGDRRAKARAVQMLIALPRDQQDPWTAKLVAALGASHEALEMVANGASSRFDWPSTLWYPSMRGVLNDPGFPAVAERLGLVKFWRTSHTRPDACSDKAPPPFCKTL
jgi:tetratricopeptide (TPR) repeat protein